MRLIQIIQYFSEVMFYWDYVFPRRVHEPATVYLPAAAYDALRRMNGLREQSLIQSRIKRQAWGTCLSTSNELIQLSDLYTIAE